MGNPDISDEGATTTQLAAPSGRIAMWLRRRHNRVPRADQPVLRLEVRFGSRADAQIGAQVLATRGTVVRAKGSRVTSVFTPPPDSVSLDKAGSFITQPLYDASVSPVDGSLHPRVSPPSRLTWHVPSLGPNFGATRAEREALREQPALLAPAGQDIAIPGHPRLRWTDYPVASFLPWSLWAFLSALVVLYLAASVGLAGTSGYQSGLVWGAVGVAVASGIAFVARYVDAGRRLWRLAQGALLLTVCYVLGVVAARSAPSPFPWGRFGVVVLLGALYVAVVVAIYSALRRSRIPGGLFLGSLSVLAGAFGASTWAAQLLARAFQTGLGTPQAHIDVGVLDLLLLAPYATTFACLVGLFLLGLAVWVAVGIRRDQVLVVVFGVTTAILVVVTTFTTQLAEVAIAGQRIASGNLENPGRVASCVRLGVASPQPVPSEWTRAGVLVGPASGPSVFIQPSRDGGEPTTTIIGGSVTVQQLAPSACRTKP